MTYVAEHLDIFRESVPGEWPKTSILDWLGNRNLPVRDSVRESLVARDTFKAPKDWTNAEWFWLILAWGRIQRKNADRVLTRQSAWLDAFSAIRHAQTRATAYDIFAEISRRCPGMGPAYFTKLLFFGAPHLNAYIMDQWTARSINLLCGRSVVTLTSGHYVCKSNTSAAYVEFCEIVDHLAAKLSGDGIELSGADIEQRLFSTGGRSGKAAPWREHVRSQAKNRQCKVHA